MTLDKAEWWVQRAGAAATLLTLLVVLSGVWRGLHRSRGRATGSAPRILRAPILFLIAVGYSGACFVLWRPLPLTLSPPTRILALILGLLLYFPGLALYLWGRLKLREMFGASSGLGVQLYADHRLVTSGPFAYVRHPMYLALLTTALGGVLVYRTWTFVFNLLIFLSLFGRARREEQALAAEFGERWKAYCQRVPAWIPCLRRR